jgi:hypothetical protein
LCILEQVTLWAPNDPTFVTLILGFLSLQYEVFTDLAQETLEELLLDKLYFLRPKLPCTLDLVKVNFVNFDYVYKKKYKNLQYKIDIIKIIMKNTFILYVFDIVRLYIFNNIFGQILSSLTLTKPRMQDKNRRREYIPWLNVSWWDFLLAQET